MNVNNKIERPIDTENDTDPISPVLEYEFTGHLVELISVFPVDTGTSLKFRLTIHMSNFKILLFSAETL